MNSKLLEIKNLKVVGHTRGSTQTIIDNLSFELNEGESLGIVGESGSGKTILSKSIMRVLDPSCKVVNGRIVFEGKDIYGLSKEELKKIRGFQIAIIYDDPLAILDPICVVEKQVREAIMTYQEGISKSEAIKKVMHMFQILKMPDPEKIVYSFAYQLSGGMQQRVAIALALVGKPKLLIADDATRALDVTIAAQTIEFLREIKQSQRVSLIWISHSLPVCSLLADKIMIMHAGKCIEIGTKDKVLRNPKHFYTKLLLKVTPDVNSPRKKLPLLSGKSNVSSTSRYDNGCEFCDICENVKPICYNQAPTLKMVDNNHFCRCHIFN